MEGNSPSLSPIKRPHSLTETYSPTEVHRLEDNGSPSKQVCFVNGRMVGVATNPSSTATRLTVDFPTSRALSSNEIDKIYSHNILISIRNQINNPSNIVDVRQLDDGFILRHSQDRESQLIVDTRPGKCPLDEDIRAELNDCLLNPDKEEANNRENLNTASALQNSKEPLKGF